LALILYAVISFTMAHIWRKQHAAVVTVVSLRIEQRNCCSASWHRNQRGMAA